MTAKKRFAVGIDIGATSIKAGVIDRNGKILDRVTVDTKTSKGPVRVIKQISLALEEIFSRSPQAECIGIGIGSPGVVNADAGTVSYPPNFSDWKEVSLAKAIHRLYPLPIFIENDANCAAIAEARFGAGMEYKDFLFVIWGTGVGGGIILDRKIYRGPFGGAGEIGHVSIDYNGRECNCGNIGCIEAYVGQRYLSQRTKEIIEAMPEDAPPSKIVALVEEKLDKIEPSIISQAAEQGDPTAIEILEEAGNLLGVVLASIVNVLDLRIVVIGGGISAAPSFVFNAIEESVRSRVLEPHKAGVHVLRAKLGNPAGMIGAASLVL